MNSIKALAAIASFSAAAGFAFIAYASSFYILEQDVVPFKLSAGSRVSFYRHAAALSVTPRPDRDFSGKNWRSQR